MVVDGRAVRQRTGLVVITNAQLYGPALRLAPQAQLDDGWLEVYIFKGASPLDVIRHFVLIAMGKHAQDPKVDIYRAHQVQVRAERPMPLHLDGDPVGFTRSISPSSPASSRSSCRPGHRDHSLRAGRPTRRCR